MSWLTVAVCEVCGRQKGEANHWMLYSTQAWTGWVIFHAWDAELSTTYGHLCSEECAHKLLSRYLSGETSPSSEPKGEHHG